VQSTLNISEIFYSIQGEGRFIGTPMTFIRLAGCSLKCSWCDTKYSWEKGKTRFISHIIRDLPKPSSNKVCITGGEPTEQDLRPLVEALRKEGYKIHLETNGTREIERELFDWITLSPKENWLWKNIEIADEIKCVIAKEEDLYKYKDLSKYKMQVYYIPVDNNLEIAKLIVDYIMKEKGVRLGWQLQKTVNFK